MAQVEFISYKNSVYIWKKNSQEWYPIRTTHDKIKIVSRRPYIYINDKSDSYY